MGINNIENKHSLYRREDCIEKFCIFLREDAANVIDFEKKENVAVNKKSTKIAPRCNKMLHL